MWELFLKLLFSSFFIGAPLLIVPACKELVIAHIGIFSPLERVGFFLTLIPIVAAWVALFIFIWTH